MRAWALAIALAVGAASTAMAEMPQDIADSIRRIGPVINPAETAKLYAPLQAREPYREVVVERDRTYGPHDRNRLDLFKAAQAGSAKPVLIFVHGGGYERGDKRTGTSPFYDNVALWAVANGMVGLNITYRLAPGAAWPAAADDIAAAVAWTRSNIAEHGGDPNRIFVMGHSAGASHVGSFIARGGAKDVRGAVLVSGTYALDPLVDVPGQKSYFGADTTLWAQRSSIDGLGGARVPLLVAHGEVDAPYYIKQADMLKAALCGQGRCPTFVALKNHSHMSEIYAVNTADTSLTEPIAAFVKRTK
jgi:acetyl esterase/lipase